MRAALIEAPSSRVQHKSRLRFCQIVGGEPGGGPAGSYGAFYSDEDRSEDSVEVESRVTPGPHYFIGLQVQEVCNKTVPALRNCHCLRHNMV